MLLLYEMREQLPLMFFNYSSTICLNFCYNNIIEEMIVIEVIKNHLTPLKKSDYTKIHNLRDTLHRPLTATSEQSVFSWQNYYGFTGYDGGDFFLVYSSRLQRFLYPFGNVGHVILPVTF